MTFGQHTIGMITSRKIKSGYRRHAALDSCVNISLISKKIVSNHRLPASDIFIQFIPSAYCLPVCRIDQDDQLMDVSVTQ